MSYAVNPCSFPYKDTEILDVSEKGFYKLRGIACAGRQGAN
jgi:hypothetical protein